jgi:hypothetical protein
MKYAVLKYPGPQRRDSTLALLFGGLSLPFVGSLVDMNNDAPQGLPSALSLALLFVFLVPLPLLAWLLAFRSSRGFREPEQLFAARFGENRVRFVMFALLRQIRTLFFLGWGLCAVCFTLHYGEAATDALREMMLMTPVVLAWASFVAVFFQAIRSWGHKLGLVLVALFYPFFVAGSVPFGPPANMGSAWTHPRAEHLLSPFFHLAYLLGAFVEQLPFPGWVSLLSLAAYALLSLALLLVRVPR